MPKGRTPRIKNEEFMEVIKPLFVSDEWTELKVKEISGYVKDQGITYSEKGIKSKLNALVKEGKLLYQTDWPTGKWKLPAPKLKLKRKDA